MTPTILAGLRFIVIASLSLLLLGIATTPARATSLDEVRERGSVRIGYLPGEVPLLRRRCRR